jgi:hypothetical protein
MHHDIVTAALSNSRDIGVLTKIAQDKLRARHGITVPRREIIENRYLVAGPH